MCAMTGLNILSLVLLGEGVRRTGEGFVGCQEVRRSRGQYIENQHSPQPSPIVEGVNIGDQSGVPHEIDCHPELVSGSHKMFQHRRQSDFPKMLKHRGQSDVQHDVNNFPKRTYSFINLFSYSPRKRAAFTLAEVLITLGIIGVVAALTMPALIANYRHKVLETQFKKQYSIIQQALLQVENSEGMKATNANFPPTTFAPVFFKQLSVIVDCKSSGCEKMDLESAGGIYANLTSKTYKTYNKSTYINSTLFDDGQVMTTDGSFIMLNHSTSGQRITITVDTNGYKNSPNIWGYDLFTFDILESNGKLAPMGAEGTYYEGHKDNFCSLNSSNKLNGITCAYHALYDPNYFKKLKY